MGKEGLTNVTELWIPEELRVYVKSSEDIMDIQVPDKKWIIPGILVEGLNALASVPKVGKTTLSFDFAVSVAQGEKLLGLEYEPIKGRTLYMALDEADIARTQERIEKRTNGKGIPNLLMHSFNFPRTDEHGLEYLEKFLEASPEPVHVVVIDILQKFLPGYVEDAGAYQKLQQYLPPIRKIAHKYHVAFLGLSHFTKEPDRKSDWSSAIYGNTATQGEVDNILGLFEIADYVRVLRTKGRDIRENEYRLTWDAKLERSSIDTTYATALQNGIRQKLYTAKVNPNHELVLSVLQELEGCDGAKSGQISDAMQDFEVPPGTTRSVLSELRVNKDIDLPHWKATKLYRLANRGCENAA